MLQSTTKRYRPKYGFNKKQEKTNFMNNTGKSYYYNLKYKKILTVEKVNYLGQIITYLQKKKWKTKLTKE